jgi:hypothetical protein
MAKTTELPIELTETQDVFSEGGCCHLSNHSNASNKDGEVIDWWVRDRTLIGIKMVRRDIQKTQKFTIK